ncbi:hypothetical protein ACP70R_032763 [Stipagrostis hirtigluma subsp. patula]
MADWYTETDDENSNLQHNSYLERSVDEVRDLFDNLGIVERDDFITSQAQPVIDAASDNTADDAFLSLGLDEGDLLDAELLDEPDMDQVNEPLELDELEVGLQHLQLQQERYWPHEDLPALIIEDQNEDHGPQVGNHGVDEQRLPQAVSEIRHEGAVDPGDNLRYSCEALYMTSAATSAAQTAFQNIACAPVRRSPQLAASTAIYMISLLTDSPQCPEAISFVTGVAAQRIRMYYGILHPHANDIVPKDFGDYRRLPAPKDD